MATEIAKAGEGRTEPGPPLDFLYGAVQNARVTKAKPAQRKGAEEARNRLPELLDAAENGRATVITRHGHAVAALVPIGIYESRRQQQSLLSLVGSGRGLWGRDSAVTIAALREEWSR